MLILSRMTHFLNTKEMFVFQITFWYELLLQQDQFQKCVCLPWSLVLEAVLKWFRKQSCLFVVFKGQGNTCNRGITQGDVVSICVVPQCSSPMFQCSTVSNHLKKVKATFLVIIVAVETTSYSTYMAVHFWLIKARLWKHYFKGDRDSNNMMTLTSQWHIFYTPNRALYWTRGKFVDICIQQTPNRVKQGVLLTTENERKTAAGTKHG